MHSEYLQVNSQDYSKRMKETLDTGMNGNSRGHHNTPINLSNYPFRFPPKLPENVQMWLD